MFLFAIKNLTFISKHSGSVQNKIQFLETQFKLMILCFRVKTKGMSPVGLEKTILKLQLVRYKHTHVKHSNAYWEAKYPN